MRNWKAAVIDAPNCRHFRIAMSDCYVYHQRSQNPTRYDGKNDFPNYPLSLHSFELSAEPKRFSYML